MLSARAPGHRPPVRTLEPQASCLELNAPRPLQAHKRAAGRPVPVASSVKGGRSRSPRPKILSYRVSTGPGSL